MRGNRIDASAFAQRLSAELARRGWNAEIFQERVHKKTGGARGSSYGTVWAYLHGEVSSPRRDIAQTMAEILGVRPDWLIEGKGPRAPDEEFVREAIGEAAPHPLEGFMEVLKEVWQREWPGTFETHPLDGHTLYAQHALRLVYAAGGPEKLSPSEMRAVLSGLIWLWRLPQILLDVDLDPVDLRRYWLAMGQVLDHLLPEKHETFDLSAHLPWLRNLPAWLAGGASGLDEHLFLEGRFRRVLRGEDDPSDVADSDQSS